MNRSASLAGVLAFAILAGTGCLDGRGGDAPPTPDEPRTAREEPAAPARDSAEPAPNQSELAALPDIVQRALPSVVGISTRRAVRTPMPMFRHPFMPPNTPGERFQEGMGSGVIVTTDGVIVTNSHVVAEADDIQVRLYDGRTLSASVVGTDEKSDVAVIRLDEPPEGLTPMPYGDSDAIRLGETVIAIGNPFGLSSTVTMGIVSAKGRANVGIVDYEDFIQTDAAVNPGNSGGALVNMAGELIGINSAILSRSGGYQGIAFAIPSNMAHAIHQSLVAHGEVRRGWLGVMIQSLDRELAEALGADGDLRGVVVSDVQEGSPAEAAGLQRGDVIVSIAGREVKDATELRNVVALQAPGSTVEVDVVRQGTRSSMPVQLGELNGGERAASGAVDALPGLQLGQLDAEVRQRLRVPPRVGGVLVVDVEPRSQAAAMGFRPGDVVLEVNRRPVRTPEEFTMALEASQRKALFLILRQGRTLFLTARR